MPVPFTVTDMAVLPVGASARRHRVDTSVTSSTSSTATRVAFRSPMQERLDLRAVDRH
jgi:hypothetical protein